MRRFQVAGFLGGSLAVAGLLGWVLPALAQATDDDAGMMGRGDAAATQPAGQGWGQTDQGQYGSDQEQYGQGATTRPGEAWGPGRMRGDTGRMGMGERGLRPEQSREWVRIGIDTNNDGRFDAFEYVRRSELQQFRSQAAAGRPSDLGMDQERWSTEERETVTRERTGRFARSEPQRFEGRVTDLSDVDVRNRTHLLVTIQTPDNRSIQVDFGPRGELRRELSDRIRKGEAVSLTAHPSRFHRGKMFVADRVRHQEQWVALNTDWDRGMGEGERAGDRFRGEILSTRTARFRGFNTDHLLARVRMDDGSTELVDLGPASGVDNLGLRSGDQISIVARDACINGSAGLIAEELRTPGGRFVQLDNAAPSEMRLRGRPTSPDRESNEFDEPGGGTDREGRSGRSQREWSDESRTSIRERSERYRSGMNERDRDSEQHRSDYDRDDDQDNDMDDQDF